MEGDDGDAGERLGIRGRWESVLDRCGTVKCYGAGVGIVCQKGCTIKHTVCGGGCGIFRASEQLAESKKTRSK